MNLKIVLLAALCIALALPANVEGRRKQRHNRPPASTKPATASAPEPSDDTPHFPYICNITYTVAKTFICGGILVDASYVATAAHCVDSIKLSNKKQKLTVSCDNAAYTTSVTGIILHEDWLKIARLPYDIALLRLDSPSTLPIANYTAKDLVIENGTLISVEWGKVKGGYYEYSTNEGVEFVDNVTCNDASHWTRSTGDTVYCALPSEGYECSDVAGAALILMPNKSVNYSESHVFAGLSSFGTKECERHGFPIVYTSIFKHAEWMESKIHDDAIPVSREQQELLEEQFVRNITDDYKGRNSSVLLAGALTAIYNDDARALEVFFSLGLDPDTTYDAFGRKLLHYAADNDAYHCATVMVSEGANVSAVSDFGTTAVHAAAVSGSVSVATVLLGAGSYVNAVDEEYSTPLHHLLADGNGTTIQLLTLLEAGANVHVEDALDVTPLHRAAESNWVAAVKVLLRAGSNLIVYAYNDGAPIHWAAASGSVEVLELLIDAGTDIEARASAGLRETPLSYAVRNDGPLSTIQVLLDQGAFPDARDMDGYTPLHRAAERGELDIIAALVEAGASVTRRNQDGDYPRNLFCKKHNCYSRKNRSTSKLLKVK